MSVSRRFLPRTLKSALQLLVLVAVIPGFVLAFYSSVLRYQRAEDRAYDTVRQATRLALRLHESVIDSTRLRLQLAAERIRDLQLDEMCPTLPAALPPGQSALIVAAPKHGGDLELICDLSADGPHSTPIPDAVGNAVRSAAATGTFATGGYSLSPSGVSTLVAAQPVTVRGDRAWYLLASIPLDWFPSLTADVRLPPNSVITIVSAEAVVVARYPYPQEWVGRSVPDERLFTLISGPEEGAEAVGLDGVRRLYAFAEFGGAGADASHIAVGVPSVSVFRDAQDDFRWSLIWLLAVSVFGVVLARSLSERFVLRKAAALLAAAERLARGDLSVRIGQTAGHDEMSVVSRAFDDMADNVQRARELQEQNYAELLRKEASLRASQDAIEAQRQGLDRLSQELLRVQEKERQHIARELHDEIGQSLTALKINLQIEQAATASARLTESVSIVDRLLTEIRELSLSLRPPLLQEQGLSSAVRYLLRSEAQRSGLRTEHRIVVGDARFSPEIELAVFRIVQEALTNVTRHAKATTVTVAVDQDDDVLEVTIKDDGAGFDMRQIAQSATGFGLLSMKERAELIGGHLEFHSAPGCGTTIQAHIPISQ
jgi:signal transduction histidine kinase